MGTLRQWFALPEIVPAEDYGFFGPGSVTWRVWSYPTSLTIGFQRAVVIEELDPALVASVDATHDIYNRPQTRYDRTLHYFAMVAFGDSRSTTRAADEQRYWADCALAAELQTCDPDAVPRTRAGIAAYFEQMRPHLIGSDIARKAMNHLLRGEVMMPRRPAVLRLGAKLISAVVRRGTLATMPRWMREMSGLPTSRVLDGLVVAPLRISFRVIGMSSRLQLLVLQQLSPSTVTVAAPVLRSVPARTAVTATPRAAQHRFGYDNPRDAHQDLRARQRRRVFDEGRTPSDEGIIESQPILGTVG